ncbi:hypothetical protein TrRE_jg1077, partial [Triparma retinervis]
MAAVGAATKRK